MSVGHLEHLSFILSSVSLGVTVRPDEPQDSGPATEPMHTSTRQVPVELGAKYICLRDVS